MTILLYCFYFNIINLSLLSIVEKDITIDSPDFLPQEKDESLKLQDISIKEHSRTRRATCDFLSGFGVNHSACASHCYLRGKTGGRCNSKGVCVCRA